MKLRYIIMNVANIIEKQVLDLYKTTAYQKLNAYYGQQIKLFRDHTPEMEKFEKQINDFLCEHKDTTDR